MNNKELFINGFLDRLSKQYAQSKDEAFEIFSIAAFLDKTFQDVADNVQVLGNQDGGIDGVWLQDQSDYYVMHVFQCKNTPKLSANEVDKFRNDIKDIFIDGNKIGKQNVKDLNKWIDEYKQISDKGIFIEIKSYFVFNGLNQDTKYAANKDIFDTYNNPDNNFYIIDSNSLYDKIANLARQKRHSVKFTFHPEQSNISALDSQGLYTYAIQDIRAANFRITATELCQLMDEEKKINGSIESLFEENIRSYLGIKVRANKRMNDTLNKREDAVYFPFLNNGITIICEELKLPKQPQNDIYILPVTNPQIVNGLQTSWVLYNFYLKSPNLLKDIYVNIRVYETRDKELIENITDATNTQTPINYRDKISTKDFNVLTKQVFSNAGILYITKRGEIFKRDKENLLEDVNSETVIKFWYATFYEEPHTAKNSIASVLQKIFDASTFEQHPLEKLFDGNKDSAIYKQLLTAYRIYKYVQYNKKTYLQEYEFLVYADELMCYGIYKYIGCQLNKYTDMELLNTAYLDTLQTINTIVENDKTVHKEVGKTFSFNAYFKKPKSKVDFNSLKGIIESDTLFEDIKNIR
ncbi:MAG: AIPR family protein [Methylococcales bacterium]|nr:AIPR family protein [Methylococcales bacterium]